MSKVLARVTLREKSQATIPAEVRAALHVDSGDDLEFVVDEVSEAVTVRGLKTIAADQAWFWGAQWQEEESEAEADLVAGRTTTYDDGDAFLAALS